ncbi:MAG TPA: DUF3192 domain-containing protein [Gammaproteobacteria bacterium]|nr:DUF3192 domain-containing protein [Gammaproteobacteria bacterium]
MTRKARDPGAARAALFAFVLLAGCAPLVMDSVEALREANKSKLGKLSAGMPRAEAESIMGSDAAGGKLGDVLFGRLQHLEVRNPMREELVRGADGADYEVLFYYTDLRSRDDKVTDDELTPLVFRDGRLAGIGYAYLGAQVPKYASTGR